MEEVLVLKPNPWKWLGFLLTFVAFTAIGIWMAIGGDRLGWFCAAFFGLGIPVSVVQFLPGSSFLKLEPDGFTFCSMYRKSKVDWKDVLKFGTFSPARGARMVCFNLRPESKQYKFWYHVSSAVSGWHAGMPDTYGKSADDLLSLMEEWREKYGT